MLKTFFTTTLAKILVRPGRTNKKNGNSFFRLVLFDAHPKERADTMRNTLLRPLAKGFGLPEIFGPSHNSLLATSPCCTKKNHRCLAAAKTPHHIKPRSQQLAKNLIHYDIAKKYLFGLNVPTKKIANIFLDWFYSMLIQKSGPTRCEIPC